MESSTVLRGYLCNVTLYTYLPDSGTAIYEFLFFDRSKEALDVLFRQIKTKPTELSWTALSDTTMLMRDLESSGIASSKRGYGLDTVLTSCVPRTINLMWKTITGRLLRKLYESMDVRFYTECYVDIDPITNLVSNIKYISEDPTMMIHKALFYTTSEIETDALITTVAFEPDTTLAFNYLQSLVNGNYRPTDFYLEIKTKQMKYCSSHAPRIEEVKKSRVTEADFSDLFIIKDTVVANEYHLRSLIPVFEIAYFHTETFSVINALVAYKVLFDRTYYSTSFDGVVPYFIYLGPETAPKGETGDYFTTPCFPNWITCKFSSPDDLKDHQDSFVPLARLFKHLHTGAYGMRTLYILNGAETVELPIELTDEETRLAERWPGGKIEAEFEDPVALNGFTFTKFDFTSFFPTLYCALIGKCTPLAHAVAARTDPTVSVQLKAHIKEVILYFFGSLKHTNPSAYNKIIAVCNLIAEFLDGFLSDLGLGVLLYIKDGFICMHAETAPPPIEARSMIENAVSEFLKQKYPNINMTFSPKLKLEGMYTHAILFSVNKYWLWNQNDDSSDCVGFSTNGQLALDAKALLGRLLKIVSRCSTAEESDALTLTDLNNFIYSVYLRKYDQAYWGVKSSVPACLPSKGLHKLESCKRTLDCGHLMYVPIVNQGRFYYSLYSHPACFHIDYIRSLTATLTPVTTAYRDAMRAKYETEHCFKLNEELWFLFK
ncbi:helicase-primase subunit [Testudinid alphaherpesvirus 3]|uniref:Helicase-primase subunit n=1 Tax=Testudinid alphaherpesvirus 3 TaxID=2560801 RepID=A0A0K1R193_9ALPH|nr:helicase-primase subunit [Testudinid alphaherpesvirus 3]AIU39287.1 helicase-primase subunit [Testudinid alphaherpesvirus 3]AKV40679.1 UL8 DNA helicase/primase complex protein [Testudinid alphaherpesvirus 3]